MKKIKIIGAELGERELNDGTYDAWYTCKRCGQELGCAEMRRTAAEAREKALARFDIQSRNFCYTCGNKLTEREEMSR